MNMKLSALALGLTLAYGVTAAMAADATIDQSGGFNTAVIDQYSNDGSEVEASITTSGWRNNHQIDQTRSNYIWAEIDAPGSFNTASINQASLDNAGAHIYQGASGSTAAIDQGAYENNRRGRHHYSRDGHSQWAYIFQESGWGHDANIKQTGGMVETSITQYGFNNSADVTQRGTGEAYTDAFIVQSGRNNTATVTQTGYNLDAEVRQSGVGHVAVVDLRGNGHTASVNQSGWANTARITQRN